MSIEKCRISRQCFMIWTILTCCRWARRRWRCVSSRQETGQTKAACPCRCKQSLASRPRSEIDTCFVGVYTLDRRHVHPPVQRQQVQGLLTQCTIRSLKSPREERKLSYNVRHINVHTRAHTHAFRHAHAHCFDVVSCWMSSKTYIPSLVL